MIKVLFVCMANVCRSPMAEAIFSKLVKERNLSDQIYVDSAGTNENHTGCNPDLRAQKETITRGIKIDHLIARQVVSEDFDEFDYIIAMDKENLKYLDAICPKKHRHKISLMLSYDVDSLVSCVPDPYYYGENGFKEVFNMLETSAIALLDKLYKNHLCENPA